MYCANCGSKVYSDAVVCVGCGRSLPQQPKGWSFMKLVFLYLITLLFPVVGVIFSIVGMCSKGKGWQGVTLFVFSVWCVYVWARLWSIGF